MARKLGITREGVIAAAARLADARGIDELNLASLAGELGVRPPSLHHHIGGLRALRRELALEGAARLRVRLRDAAAGLHGQHALAAVARTYRAFARQHPGLLAAMLPAPRRGEDDELYQALAAPVADLARILSGLGIEGEAAVHVIRALRSYLHGFADLERQRGFGMAPKLNASFERGLEIFISGLGAG